jgi:uncharacterized protein YlzI (FlbEa/FlbD family)
LIALSKLDGTTMYLNEDHVERVEQGANSAVYLTNGTYLIVRDHVDTINDSIRSEKTALLSAALGKDAPDAVTALRAVLDETPRMQSRS